MALQTTWFVLIAVLWIAFFVLEGFDFGVGMLTPLLGHDEEERRALKATTGPFWDGNEVWLLVAGGATFAAFPDWYATMFSAYYLPLFVVLVALILRATGIEYRDRRESPRWRTTWDWLIAGSCLLVPLLVGVVFGGLLGGLPIDADKEFTGSFVDLVRPYALVTGLVFLAMCVFHGLVFIRIRTDEALQERASRWAGPVGIAVTVLLVVHVVWTQTLTGGRVIPGPAAWIAMTFAVAATWIAFEPRHAGWAFACSTGMIGATVASVFGTLYPNLMVSTTSSSFNITTADSSGSYTLTLMTIVAAVMVPVVLIYTAWSYWVFRSRITRASMAEPSS